MRRSRKSDLPQHSFYAEEKSAFRDLFHAGFPAKILSRDRKAYRRQSPGGLKAVPNLYSLQRSAPPKNTIKIKGGGQQCPPTQVQRLAALKARAKAADEGVRATCQKQIARRLRRFGMTMSREKSEAVWTG
jgi:hypothetical protein